MRTKALLSILLLLLFSWGTTDAQEHQNLHQTQHTDTAKVNSVKELFTKGEVEGHIRNYTMATINHKALSDNYANAIGAKIGFRTAPFYGFRLGLAGLFTYNAFSSDLTEADPIAGKLPRFELELFDVQNPENKADLDRLDELYLEYKTDKIAVQLGRIGFTSPLINPQDTRMKPYAVQGVSIQVPMQQNSTLSLAWFDHFSPRSTVEWVKAEESIGIYSTGVDIEGNPSQYEHNTHTKGVAVAGYQVKPSPKLQAEVWNYWIQNISNNMYGKAVWELAPHVKFGTEALYQFRVGNGGNDEQSKAYFPDQKQWLVGGRLAYEPTSWQLSLNYLHIGSNGQFLFPREWGREQFFVTLPRGRMEGSGNSDLMALRVKKSWSKHISLEGAVSRSWFPDKQDYQHNKYGAVPYWGYVADLNYKPAKPVLDGLSFRLLYVGRTSPTNNLDLKDMYYSTNFHHFNLVTQITF